MDAIITFLTQYGYWGMLVAAFLAGSIFPFSSEAVMIGLMATGLDPWLLMVYGTVGNVLGSIVNYCLGRLPVLGSAITIALGLMRSNIVITFIAITLGKIFRYLILIYGAGLFM